MVKVCQVVQNGRALIFLMADILIYGEYLDTWWDIDLLWNYWPTKKRSNIDSWWKFRHMVKTSQFMVKYWHVVKILTYSEIIDQWWKQCPIIKKLSNIVLWWKYWSMVKYWRVVKYWYDQKRSNIGQFVKCWNVLKISTCSKNISIRWKYTNWLDIWWKYYPTVTHITYIQNIDLW